VRFFYDTEFNERGSESPLELVSIGMVADDGRSYFACNGRLDVSRATTFVREHVLPSLPPRASGCWKLPPTIAHEIRAFVGVHVPELWSDFAAFDHVILAQLFGGMDDWPRGWPMFTCDIQQWRLALGSPELPKLGDRLDPAVAASLGVEAARRIETAAPGRHDALLDALLTRVRWLALARIGEGGSKRSRPTRPGRRQ